MFFLYFQSFCQYKMFMLDRPLVPKYSKASLNSVSSATSGISSASSKNLSLHSQSTVTTVCSVPPKPNGKTLSRASSAASLGRPYQTTLDDPKGQRKARSAPDKSNQITKAKKKVKDGQRQWSADSGVDTSFPRFVQFTIFQVVEKLISKNFRTRSVENTVWKNKEFSLTKKIFHQIKSLVEIIHGRSRNKHLVYHYVA